jgi:uncharacterized MAPEG superfamily protein
MPIAAWCLMLVALMPVVTVGIAKWGAGYDNHEPRQWMQTLEGYRRRAYAAHINGYEALSVFLAALFIAVWTDGPTNLVDTLAVIFVLARVAYLAAYIADKPAARSLVWSLGYLACIGLALSGLLPHP